MEIKINECNEKALSLSIVGRLDSITSPIFLPKVEEAYNSGDIIIDCNELEYVSSAGLRALMSLYKKARSNNGTLRMRGVNVSVNDVLRMTNLDSVFVIE